MNGEATNGATINTPVAKITLSGPVLILIVIQISFMLLLYSLHERQSQDHDNIASALDRNSCVLAFDPTERKEMRDIIRKHGWGGACPQMFIEAPHRPRLLDRIFGGDR